MITSSSYSKRLSKPIIDALEEGRKIEAIKLLRKEQNLELMQAKHIIDQYIQHNPNLRAKFSPYQSEFGRNILFFMLMTLAFVIFIYFK